MDSLEQIAAAVLYEGYVLWPYRRSARKNQQRWTFGGVYPSGFVERAANGDRSSVQCQCLVRGASARVTGELRFLQVVRRQPANPDLHPLDELETADGQRVLAWDEAIEHRLPPGAVIIAAGERREMLPGGVVVRSWQEVRGHFDLSVAPIGDGLWRVTAALANTIDWPGTDRDAAQRSGFMSAHFVLRVDEGAFVSMTDPPAELADAATACQNVGLWPVLVTDAQTVLASPIILSDYPRIAPESPGLLFDSGEIDQLLYLNTLTLTDTEKAEVRATDPRARELLDRAEALSPEQLGQLHGAIRELRVLRPEEDPWPTLYSDDASPPTGVLIGGKFVQKGSPVRLRPRGRADVFDMALDGKLATVESIEEDFDNRVQLAVTVDDDPGRDLGALRLPGHRFFFSPAEVEPLA